MCSRRFVSLCFASLVVALFVLLPFSVQCEVQAFAAPGPQLGSTWLGCGPTRFHRLPPRVIPLCVDTVPVLPAPSQVILHARTEIRFIALLN